MWRELQYARTRVLTLSSAPAQGGGQSSPHLCLWTRDARVFSPVWRASFVCPAVRIPTMHTVDRAPPPPARPSCPASAAGQDDRDPPPTLFPPFRTTHQPHKPPSSRQPSSRAAEHPNSRTSEQPSSHVVRRRELGSADLLHGRRLRRRSHHGRHRQDVPQGTVRHGCTRAVWWKSCRRVEAAIGRGGGNRAGGGGNPPNPSPNNPHLLLSTPLHSTPLHSTLYSTPEPKTTKPTPPTPSTPS